MTAVEMIATLFWPEMVKVSLPPQTTHEKENAHKEDRERIIEREREREVELQG